MKGLIEGIKLASDQGVKEDESLKIASAIGEALSHQSDQIVESASQLAIVRSAKKKAKGNQDTLRNISESLQNEISEFQTQCQETSKLGRGSSYNEVEVPNISFSYTLSSSDISQTEASQQNVETQQSETSQQNVETPVSESVDEPLMQQPEVDLANASSQVDEAWVKAKVLDFKCVKSLINSCNLGDDWTFSNLSKSAFMEFYKIFNGKRAEQSLNAEGVKIYNYLCKVKEDRGF